VTLVPIGQGIAASVIATMMVGAWIAIGSLFLKGFKSNDGITAPGAILIGSSITSFALALFCVYGMVSSGTIIVAGASLVIAVVRWRRMWAITTGIFDPFVDLTRRWVVLAFALILWVIVWAAAISPPRSADAMRYHLAHIRQIVQDGRWERIADYHYALPFGWSLSYLPFEILGLPQGAQVLGLALLVVFIASTVRVFKWAGASRSAILLSLLLVLHPASLRVFTEANADAYAVLVILTISALVLRITSLHWREAALLGFVSWIGLQSRYQLVAAAIAVTILLAFAMRHHPARVGAMFSFAGGSLAAIALAAPFYAANEKWFGNPVWPLMIGQSPKMSYADKISYYYSLSLSGTHSPGDYWFGISRLMTVPYQFPLGILIVGTIVIAALRRGREIRLLGLFGALFLIEWAIMQPQLYPRFILLMLPVAVLCAGFLLTTIVETHERLERPFLALASIGMIALVTLAAAVNRPSLRYVKSGDADEYHRYTWFYRAYQWVNAELPLESRMLVVVSSGTSYYLERPYRRADPWISGVVDWPKVNNAAALDSVLAEGRFDYVFYEDRDWSTFLGGKEMQNAMVDGYRRGSLKRVMSFVDTLYTSRFDERYRITQALLLKRTAR
jgi:hypothetical protein